MKKHIHTVYLDDDAQKILIDTHAAMKRKGERVTLSGIVSEALRALHDTASFFKTEESGSFRFWENNGKE